MPLTYEPIATTTLSAIAGTITFSSIPSTYTDLRIVLNAKADTSADGVGLRFNSDTASNYSHWFIYGDGTSFATNGFANQTYLNLSWARQLQTNYPALFTIDVMSYANSVYKGVLATMANDNNGTGATYNVVGTWRGAAAVNSLTLRMNGGSNFAVGTTAAVYGIQVA